MRRSGAWVLAFLVMLGATAWAKGKPKRKPKPDVVTLGFGWPSDLAASVTYKWMRTGSSRSLNSLSLGARLTVTAEGDLLRVGYRDWRAEPAGSALLELRLPSFEKMATIVDRKGALVRVDGGVTPDDAQHLAALMDTKPLDPEARKKFAEMIPIIFKEHATKTWGKLVEMWAGRELEIGVDYETDAEGPMPLLPGETMKSKFFLRAERFLDCPGRPGTRCVELKSRSEPEPKNFARLVELLGQKYGGTKDIGKGMDLSAVEELTLVTEPDRLIPHRLEIVKTIGAGQSMEDSKRAPRVDRTIWTFDYAPAPPKPPAQ